MDAFSIAISIALQYGVPLERSCQKFTNMRFDPGRHDRRPRHPDGAVDHGLHLPRLALDYLPE
jgi:ribonucleoside-diphosphate reductase alpha chain